MKKTIQLSNYLIGLALALAVLVSCNKDDEVLLADLDVTVEYADDFSSLSTANLTVTLTNTTDNTSVNLITDATGMASFTELAPGTYNLSCSVSLTAEQVQTLTGYYQEITLNAVATSVSLQGGVLSTNTLTLDGKPSADLVIKEVYYSGPPMDFSIFFKDQFVEIYNNSDEIIYADGLYVAHLGPSRAGSDANDPTSTLDFSENVYADKILRVPGTGEDYPINPGESIVIAINAVDFTAGGNTNTVDLSTADFDTYAVDWLEGLGRFGNAFFDVENVDVTTMENVFMHENANWFNFQPEGASIVIFRSESFSTDNLVLDPESSDSNPIYYAPISVTDIIDAVDFLNNSESAPWKRISTTLDAGFNYCGSSYSGKSLRRLVAKTTDGRKILKDTNNSTNDFEVLDHATPGGFGE